MNPLWSSGFITDASTFEFTFDQAGTYLYRCEVHPIEMRGRIIVQGGPAPTPTPERRPGDVDCGGSVTSIDAALVLQLEAGLLQSLSCPQNGDLNNDGRTNSLDAALILQHVAGLI